MDLPRKPSENRRPHAGIALALTLGLLFLGYAPLKHAAITALEIGSRSSLQLVGGSTADEPATPRQLRAADGAGRLEARSTSQKTDQAPSHSGGLFFPEYTRDGDVRVPTAYREWVFVGAATGLAYGEPTRERHDGAPGTFTHVYLEPGAFRHFRDTGTFPEGTTFALEMRQPTGGVSIATDGWFAGRSAGVHLAVKDTERLGGWAYFNVDGTGLARRVRSGVCSSCHADHGAVDNVFVQFYPVLTED